MAGVLSSGMLKRVIHLGERVDRLVVQVVAVKIIKASQAEGSIYRYRLTLSDGANSYAACIHSSENEFDLSGMPVIAMTSEQYSFSEVNKQNAGSRKRIMIISSFDRQQDLSTPLVADVVALDESVIPPGQQSDPNAMDVSQSVAAAMTVNLQQQPQQRAAPVKSELIPTVPGGSRGGGQATHPIRSLNPYQNKWRIRARVTNKSDIRTWSNARGEGKLFSVELRDESGEIRATAFKEQCDKFYNMLVPGSVYYFSGGVIKQARKAFTSIKNDYEIAFNQTSEISVCTDTAAVSSIPKHQYNLVTLDSLPQHTGQTVDVMGVLKCAGDVTSVTKRSDGSTLEKRDLTIVDKDMNAVTLTLWGERATSFTTDIDHPVVAIKGAMVKEFGGGVTLGTSGNTIIDFNPDTAVAHTMLSWWEESPNVHNADVKDMSARSAGSAAVGNQYKLIGFADALHLGESGDGDAPAYFNVRAHVSFVKSDTALYKACAKAGCKKKVHELDADAAAPKRYRCEKCNEEFDRFTYQAMCSLELSDMTGSHWVTLFGDQLQHLMGKTAEELGAIKESSEEDYIKLFSDITFTRHIFRIRAKVDTYQDERRIRWTVQSVRPYDPAQDAANLTDIIRKLDVFDG